jgi:hypothetical protein
MADAAFVSTADAPVWYTLVECGPRSPLSYWPLPFSLPERCTLNGSVRHPGTERRDRRQHIQPSAGFGSGGHRGRRLENNHRVIHDDSLATRLNLVTTRTLAQLPPTQLRFRVILIDSPEVNSFSVGAGRGNGKRSDKLDVLGFRGVRFSDTPIPLPASCCGVPGFVRVISDSRRIAFEQTHSGPLRAGGDARAIVLFDPGGVDVQFRTRS